MTPVRPPGPEPRSDPGPEAARRPAPESGPPIRSSPIHHVRVHQKKKLQQTAPAEPHQFDAQRSQEDAEGGGEGAKEESQGRRREESYEPLLARASQHNHPAHNTELNEELEPRCCLVLEEDEGFSDWSHRLENRTEQEVQDNCRTRVQRPSTQQWKPEPKEKKQQEGEEEEGCEPERSSWSQEASTTPPEKTSSSRKEIRDVIQLNVFLSAGRQGCSTPQANQQTGLPT
ncbi:uncharacterized protein LOC119478994 [Sebastes umbrosus]|uniref:uncharacterized protein LOC119478994 n=1 Tax=Sebastes umbrosus TaxID=72105 RepID=UPI00189E6011|nr:uncharacterized protein LOC119478994 [Sebastes umbrosus]